MHLDIAYAILGETRSFGASRFFVFEIVRESCDLQEGVENGQSLNCSHGKMRLNKYLCAG